MSRVIQDSDDDLDDELVTDVLQARRDAAPKPSTSDASSTEALRIQIEAAHRAHLQSQFPVQNGQTPTYTRAHHNKTALAAGTDVNSTSNRNSQGVYIPNRAILAGSSGSLPTSQQQDQGSIGHIPHLAETARVADWMLGGSLREVYAQHNPNVLFPEPSSTVPNATLTQQRVMEGVRAPALLGSDIENGGGSFEPIASIPWSEYLKSPTTTVEHPRSSERDPHISQNMSVAVSEASSLQQSTPSRHQQEENQLLTSNGCPSTPKTPLDIIDDQATTVTPTHVSQPKAPQSQSPITLSMTIEQTVQGVLTTSATRLEGKRRILDTEICSDDDLADMGLQKEQTKPRPSRSRSSKVGSTRETIDYSIRPEKAMKARKRIRSTPAASVLPDPIFTPSKIHRICEMGFTPSTSARALQKNNGDVTHTVDWLVTNRVGDDELVSQCSPMARVGNKRLIGNTQSPENVGGFQEAKSAAEKDEATAPTDAIDENTTFTEMDIAGHAVHFKSPSNVQVVIPAKPSVPIGESGEVKVKRRRTVPDHFEAESPTDSAKSVMAEKKRGRGRPRKELTSATLVQHGQDEGHKNHVKKSGLGSIKNAQPPQVQDSEEIETVDDDAILKRTDLKSFESGGIVPTTPEPGVLPHRPEVEPITPERVKKAAPPKQPSCTGTKMSYRVGLSKRARIAPLLRIVKK